MFKVFLMVSTVTFFIMASYILTRDNKEIFFAEELFSEENLDTKLLVKIFTSKLEYTPRKVPDEKDIIETDPNFSLFPRQFLPGIKSPCWYEEFSSELLTDPYRKNLFCIFENRQLCSYLKTSFHKHFDSRDGKVFRLRCLPFFFIVGMSKCGTTDLFRRLSRHPEVKLNTMKELHWWNRRRFGYEGFRKRFRLQDYLDVFDLTAHKVQEAICGKSSGDSRTLQLVTADASPTTFWDNHYWRNILGDQEETEPPFLTQDFIHTVLPNAKIIIILRDPVERLYSDYLFSGNYNQSAEDFHQKVIKAVQLFQSCLSERSLRFCVYSASLDKRMGMRIYKGMYVVFLLDWLTVFPREQILVLRLEDYSADLKNTLKRVINFLSLGPVSKEVENAMTTLSKANTRRVVDKRVGPMLPATRDLLREIHQPFNQKLASVLDDKNFLWSHS